MVLMTPMPRVAVSSAFLRPIRPRVAMRNLRRVEPWMEGTMSTISPAGVCRGVWGEKVVVNSSLKVRESGLK